MGRPLAPAQTTAASALLQTEPVVASLVRLPHPAGEPGTPALPRSPLHRPHAYGHPACLAGASLPPATVLNSLLLLGPGVSPPDRQGAEARKRGRQSPTDSQTDSRTPHLAPRPCRGSRGTAPRVSFHLDQQVKGRSPRSTQYTVCPRRQVGPAGSMRATLPLPRASGRQQKELPPLRGVTGGRNRNPTSDKWTVSEEEGSSQASAGPEPQPRRLARLTEVEAPVNTTETAAAASSVSQQTIIHYLRFRWLTRGRLAGRASTAVSSILISDIMGERPWGKAWHPWHVRGSRIEIGTFQGAVLRCDTVQVNLQKN